MLGDIWQGDQEPARLTACLRISAPDLARLGRLRGQATVSALIRNSARRASSRLRGHWPAATWAILLYSQAYLCDTPRRRGPL